MAGLKKERVAVFFDYENVHRTAHGLYRSYGAKLHETVFDPVELATRVVAKRSRRSELTSIRVYRGRPVPEHQPTPASAFDMQATKWKRDVRLSMGIRDLRYTFPYDDRSQFRAEEKGIDVALAVDFVEAAIKHTYDALILFSCDTDLLPALELVGKLHTTHVEIACWSGANPLFLRDGLRESPPRRFPYCHFMSEGDFNASRETAAVIK